MSYLLESNKSFIDSLFKRIRFYDLLDPSSNKMFNYNVYKLISVLIVFIIGCCMIYGQMGYFIQMEDSIDTVDSLLIIFIDLITSLSSLKIIMIVYKANDIWDLLNATRINFLTSGHCQKYIHYIHYYSNLSTKISYLLIVLLIGGLLTWGGFPLVIYAISFRNVNADCVQKERIVTAINYRYPLTINTFNEHFILFYMIELAILTFDVFVHGVFDIFIVSVGFTIIAQYEIITRAFENICAKEQIVQIYDGKSIIYL